MDTKISRARTGNSHSEGMLGMHYRSICCSVRETHNQRLVYEWMVHHDARNNIAIGQAMLELARCRLEGYRPADCDRQIGYCDEQVLISAK